MWDNQMKKAAGLEYTGKQQGRKRPVFCRDKREDDIYV